MIKTKRCKFINPTLSFLALFSITRRQAASAIAANLTFMPQKHFFKIFKLLNRFLRQWFGEWSTMSRDIVRAELRWREIGLQ